MEVKCIPKKELFSNPTEGYRVLSCELADDVLSDIELNRYGNFTLSGSNLDDLLLNKEANITVERDVDSKYPASYIMTGYVGFSFENGEVHVDPKYSNEILSRMMEPIQAKRCLEAYPDFIDMVLNGREEEINPDNIFNVGRKRLDGYIVKIKSCKTILYYPQAVAAGITSPADIQKIRRIYDTPELFEEALNENPYHIYIDLVGFSFDKADRLVKAKYPDLIGSKIRCEYGCLEILRQNESLGDCRLNANIMASEAKNLVPESYHYMVEVVKNSNLIHYDDETKYASLKSTYNAELCIAMNILERANNPHKTLMDWKPYVNTGGFQLTEEQASLLTVVQNNSVAMLIGGPGMGKSHSMKAVVRMLEGNRYSYTMLAPTGTAAKVLSKATGRKAHTVHMFLAAKMECKDFLILEEASMLGVELLAKLLSVIDREVKILFICDPCQLPSISCGNVVHDILNSGVVPVVELTKVFRYNSSGLITVATDIRGGSPKSFRNNYDDYHFIKFNGDLNQVTNVYQELLDQGYQKSDILILVPYNKTKVGTYAINNAIQAQFNKNPILPVSYKRESTTIQFKIGDRVINKKNNYHIPVLDFDEDNGGFSSTNREMFVANGSIGIIRKHYKDNNADCFAIEFEEGIGEFKGSDIGQLLLGYAVTIHASQGNQAKAVVVIIDESHKRLLNRNIFNVAFTRSQETLWVIANDTAIEEALDIEETNERDTYLCDMLKEEK